MENITSTTYPYEVLVRINKDGYVGSHRQNVLVMSSDEGGALSETVLPPYELSLEELKSFVAAL